MTGATQPSVRLRPMVETDLDQVLDLERRLFPTDPWSVDMFRSELADPARSYLVAECVADSARVVGFGGLRVAPPEGDIQTMAVERGYWSQGIGARLLRSLLETGAQRGIVDTYLAVRSDNPRAQQLYRRFGFVELGVHPGYYTGADAIVMHRSAPQEAREENTSA